MKIISVGTMKGGAGKTSFLYNFAGVVGQWAKVLLIDADPQSNLSDSVGINIADINMPSIRNIFDNPETEPEDIVVKSPIPELPDIDIISSNIFLYESEDRLSVTASREQQLKYYFDDHKKFFKQYDYILIDTNPSMGLINQNVFYLSDHIILICDGSMHAIRGLELFQYLWATKRKNLRKKDNLSAIIVGSYDARTSISGQIYDYCKNNEDLSPLLLRTTIPIDVQIKRTVVVHKPINVFMKKSRTTQALTDIYEELLERGVM